VEFKLHIIVDFDCHHLQDLDANFVNSTSSFITHKYFNFAYLNMVLFLVVITDNCFMVQYINLIFFVPAKKLKF